MATNSKNEVIPPINLHKGYILYFSKYEIKYFEIFESFDVFLKTKNL